MSEHCGESVAAALETARRIGEERKAVLMIEFDVKCGGCERPITLRVRDEQSRHFFETNGALCEVCYKPGYQPAPVRRAA